MGGATVPQEETLRGICNENVSLATEVRVQLDNALGAGAETAEQAPAPISPNVIDQALESARQTRTLLRGILETVVAGIINRI